MMNHDPYLAVYRAIDKQTPCPHKLVLIKAQCLSHLGWLPFTEPPAQASCGKLMAIGKENWPTIG